ncbi:hypothetical protein HGRIS_006948 [Hohenbuehelia grisea]|uniref:Uncharacterized protein n=1 Tax=Hohenbuehelia grisea TaxID=104357 RepID=A0ABR3JB51_9AGAR
MCRITAVNPYTAPARTVSAGSDLMYVYGRGRIRYGWEPYAFVVAKAPLPPSFTTIVLDALHIYPIPGNPNDDAYDDHLPDAQFPFVLGLGHVTSKADALDDGSKVFNVTSNEFVRGGARSSTVQCAFASANKRWANATTPSPNSNVLYFGIVSNITSSGVTFASTLTTLSSMFLASPPSHPMSLLLPLPLNAASSAHMRLPMSPPQLSEMEE